MSAAEWFRFWTPKASSEELPEIFPLAISQSDFVTTDIVAIYSKILTDVLERTHGLKEDQIPLMWDSCVKSSSADGLVTMLAKAMADKKELFLVLDAGVIRVATSDEAATIKADYAKQAKSATGIFISFQSFKKSDMVKFYIAVQYATVGSLYKSMNLAKAIQLKLNDLRASTSLVDKDEVKTQAQAIARGLRMGHDILLDAKDEVTTAVPDLSAVKESIEFTVKKLSFYLGLPDSYLIGEQTSGMGTTGENDMRAVERGLKAYFFSIMKPVLEALFSVKLEYKSQDVRQILGSMEVIKTLSLVDDSLVSHENKTKLVNQLLGLPEDAEGDAVKKPDPAAAPPPPGQKPPVPPKADSAK